MNARWALSLVVLLIACGETEYPIPDFQFKKGRCIELVVPTYILQTASTPRQLYLDTTASTIDTTIRQLPAKTRIQIVDVRYESRFEYTLAFVTASIGGVGKPVVVSRVFDPLWLVALTQAVESGTPHPPLDNALNTQIAAWCDPKPQ